MTDFKAKMHQIRLRLELRPRPRWESLQRSLRHPSWIWGQLRGRGWAGLGKRREREGRGKWRRGKGRAPSYCWTRAPQSLVTPLRSGTGERDVINSCMSDCSGELWFTWAIPRTCSGLLVSDSLSVFKSRLCLFTQAFTAHWCDLPPEPLKLRPYGGCYINFIVDGQAYAWAVLCFYSKTGFWPSYCQISTDLDKILHTPVVVRNTLVGRLRPRSAPGLLQARWEWLVFVILATHPKPYMESSDRHDYGGKPSKWRWGRVLSWKILEFCSVGGTR